MKLILFLLTFSFSIYSAEIKLVLDRPTAFTGEVIGADVENYSGPVLKEEKVGDTLYILQLNEARADLVFLKKPSVNTLPLNETDHLIWNPIEITEVQVPDQAILNVQDFDLKSKVWVLYLLIGFLILSGAVWYYLKKIKPRNILKKEKAEIKRRLFAASDLEEISKVWREKHTYIDTFSFIEDDFNKFEVTFYKYGFKPQLTEDEKKEILKSYKNFLDNIRGGNFGV
ncbi:MAG: hypothetical protein WDA09_05565 [Bacteriovoracaceae bacterium]